MALLVLVRVSSLGGVLQPQNIGRWSFWRDVSKTPSLKGRGSRSIVFYLDSVQARHTYLFYKLLYTEAIQSTSTYIDIRAPTRIPQHATVCRMRPCRLGIPFDSTGARLCPPDLRSALRFRWTWSNFLFANRRKMPLPVLRLHRYCHDLRPESLQ